MEMNITSYVFEIASRVTSTPPTAVPGILLNSYAKYLWNYETNSWVAKIAYLSRVLAIICALPVVVLGLLDIASYGIARTLGIIDDVKASTSDKATATTTGEIPVIYVNGERSPTESDSDLEPTVDHIGVEQEATLFAASRPKAFYASESGGLKLAGADVFSPAISEPPSPPISRKSPPFEVEKIEGDEDEVLGQGLRRRLIIDEEGSN